MQRTNPLDCSSFSTAAQAEKLSGDVSVSMPKSQPPSLPRQADHSRG
jgi:hypothetical protein